MNLCNLRLKSAAAHTASALNYALFYAAERIRPTPFSNTLIAPPVLPGKPLLRHSDLMIRTFDNVVFDPRYNALYTPEGHLIEETALTRGPSKRRINAPEKIKVRLNLPNQIDQAVYGGTFFDQHYGHFLTETLARLWPLLSNNSQQELGNCPWVFRKTSAFVHAPELSFLKGGNLPQFFGIPFDILTPDMPLLIKRAFVPEPANVNGQSAHTLFRKVCTHVGKRNCTVWDDTYQSNDWNNKKVYFSRRGLPFNLRHVLGERSLERRLKSLGYLIINPENLSLSEQISVFRYAHCVAGTLGSAFHTLLLSGRDDIHVVYLCDSAPQATYHVFDALCQTRPVYVNCILPSRSAKFGRHHRVMSIDKALAGIDQLHLS